MINPSAAQRPTRVGVYVDAFNVYYGARAHCGKGTAGWRWLDIGGLATSLINPRLWPDPVLDRIVYCTALRDRAGAPSSVADQKTYIEALKLHCGNVFVAHGKYVPRLSSGLLADWNGGRPRQVIASVLSFEEKGSDVNIANHLLIDDLTGRVDTAMVFSNDSDLKSPLVEARLRVPVATINPHAKPTASDLRGEASDGVRGHWWRRLRTRDFQAHQMPDPVGPHVKPAGW